MSVRNGILLIATLGFGCWSVVAFSDEVIRVGHRLEVTPHPSNDSADFFGRSLAIGDGYFAIGTDRQTTAGDRYGEVRIIDLFSGSAVTTLRNTESFSPYDRWRGGGFGAALAADDGWLVVGSPAPTSTNFEPDPVAGVVYAYNYGGGSDSTALYPAEEFETTRFGGTIATIGGRVAVRVQGADQDKSPSAWIDVFDALSGDLLGRIEPPVGPDTEFGRSLSAAGGKLAVGASGAAHLYDLSTLEKEATFSVGELTEVISFGEKVATDGEYVVVTDSSGYYETESGLGTAYVFSAVTSELLYQIDKPSYQTAILHHFATDVAISDNRILVGLWPDGYNDQIPTAAHLYDAATGNRLAELIPPDELTFKNFGMVLALRDGQAIVASPWESALAHESGSVYVFEAVPEPMSLTSSIVAACAGLAFWYPRR